MDMTQALSDVQYITREDGQRVGVVLAWEDFRTIQARLLDDPDLLPGLSESELRALSDGVLAVEHQQRLSTLLERNRKQTLSTGEAGEHGSCPSDEQTAIGASETTLGPPWLSIGVILTHVTQASGEARRTGCMV